MTSPRFLLSTDSRETLMFLLGFAGMAAMLVAYLIWSRPPEPLLVGTCLSLMGASLGAGLDRKARQRRQESAQ